MIIGLVLVGLFFAWYFFSGNGKEEVTTYIPELRDVKQKVIASGNIASAGTLDVYSTTNGVITDILVKNGQKVSKDDVLFKVESTASPQEKESAKAAYLASIDSYHKAKQQQTLYQAQLEEARNAILGLNTLYDNFEDEAEKLQYERDSLHSTDWSTRKRFTAAEEQYVNTSKTLNALSQDITAKKSLLDATENQEVVSNVNGVIANITPQIGDEVSIKNNNGTAEAILTITSFDSFTVDVNISERDIFQIELDQLASVDIDPIDIDALTGKVTKIDTLGEVDNGLVTYNVTVELNQSDPKIRAGMTTEVGIITQEATQTLTIPNASLDIRDEETVVYSGIDTMNYTVIPITTGIKDEMYTQVISGLTGDEILVDPLEIEE